MIRSTFWDFELKSKLKWCALDVKESSGQNIGAKASKGGQHRRQQAMGPGRRSSYTTTTLPSSSLNDKDPLEKGDHPERKIPLGEFSQLSLLVRGI
mmetsp:Transcript_7954/g.13433  ORF Transcript_7954/g.13433 Transcript_7954/m.13433 type:complete len:96 (+) Transcript_7954:1728-2015(+)